ncbi:rhodanese-like domain-containing protein [Psychrobacter lutiphocae]|uniref:rhodanese-like domain-containing protein n=1 Tax=Psychrobacter lutiphocae TaxID=540500 RepID=UPI00052551A9|nr:rhodanese-like domain-containing protein [Psychrobacter lutiphocae]
MGNHPVLFGILLLLIILFFTLENKRSGKKIAPNALGILVNSQNAQIIDIRAKKKFETGYIQGSRNIPFTQLKDHLEEIRAIDVPVVIVCDMGIQAGAAVQLIGKPNVFRLDGGIGGWQAAGMPLVGGVTKKGKTVTGKAKSR